VEAAEIHAEVGPLLILAGPGTGKTYQLAKRLKHLQEAGVEPDSVTVITFTAAAAANMRDRISDTRYDSFIPVEQQPRTICTMHSLGLQILRAESPDKESYGVASDDDIREALAIDAARLAGC
jgi:DNA helicase-2/ATP-dependent DNA helicase PcrA